MPIYQYECEECQQEFEEFKTIDDRETTKCPVCDGEAKLIPSGGHFKLIGNWYGTNGSY